MDASHGAGSGTIYTGGHSGAVADSVLQKQMSLFRISKISSVPFLFRVAGMPLYQHTLHCVSERFSGRLQLFWNRYPTLGNFASTFGWPSRFGHLGYVVVVQSIQNSGCTHSCKSGTSGEKLEY